MRRFFALLEKHPIVSFIILIVLLSAIIVTASKLRAPEAKGDGVVKEDRRVTVFVVGEDAASITLPAQVEKSGIVNVVALSSGIVERISVLPGQKVAPRQTLVTLTNDYGANASALRAEIARKNEALTNATLSDAERLAKMERERDKDDATSDEEEEIARKNYQIAKRSLENDAEVSRLTTLVAEAERKSLSPTSPIAGTVQNITVSIGEFVSAGTVIATIAATVGTDTLKVKVPYAIALLVDADGQHTLTLEGKTFTLTPRFFSTTEDKDGLSTLKFTIPQDVQGQVADNSFTSVSLALEKERSGSVLIPLDALFQESEQSSVSVLGEENRVESQAVTVKRVIGGFALVDGLSRNTHLITDRLVVVGESVTPLR